MVTMDTTEIQQLKAVAASIVLAMIANCIFYILGFYSYPKIKAVKEERLSMFLILKAFIVFLVSSMIIIPSVTSLWFILNGWDIPKRLPSYTETWVYLIGIWLTLTLFLGFIFLLDASTRKVVFGRSDGLINSLFLGFASWLVAYPTMLVFGNLLSYGIYKFFGQETVDQIAVEKLKTSSQYPLQYQLMISTIVIIVPFLEETLFRGFLQTWIRQHANTMIAIVTTSAIFAFFHYSSLQGLANIQFIISLFVLSCFLGYLRERQQSIWAPLALHSCFNGMSILILYVTSISV